MQFLVFDSDFDLTTNFLIDIKAGSRMVPPSSARLIHREFDQAHSNYFFVVVKQKNRGETLFVTDPKSSAYP